MADRRRSYEKNKRVRRYVSFNKEVDKELLDYLEDKEFSTFVKKLILERKEKDDNAEKKSPL